MTQMIKKYLGRPLTVLEREHIMGFPEGYVEKPVRSLFQEELLEKGIMSRDWKNKLDKKYHKFAGNYHKLRDSESYKFAFLEQGDTGEVRVLMAPPPTGKTAVSVCTKLKHPDRQKNSRFAVLL